MGTEGDAEALKLLQENWDKPVKIYQFLQFRKDTNEVLRSIWSHLDQLQEVVDILISVVNRDPEEDWVRRSLFALKYRLGRRVEVYKDLVLEQDDVERQLGEAAAEEIFEGGEAMNLKGCHAVVTDCDPETKRVLVRVLQEGFLLWVEEDELRELDLPKGVLSRGLPDPEDDITGAGSP